MKHSFSYYLVNGITLYRLLAAPILIFLIFTRQDNLFKWLLALSFFTDSIDGFLARRYKVASVFGSRLDSIADDLTIVAALFGLLFLKPDFLRDQMLFLVSLLALFIVQVTLALFRYRKITSFHTYGAKLAMICQGVFLILVFFLPQPPYVLFLIAWVVTALDLIEEIILVLILPEWQANVRGLFWVRKRGGTRMG